MADGRLFEKKPLNRHNSAVVRRIAMKFGVKRHKTLLNLATDKIWFFWKPRWQTADAQTRPRSIYWKQLSKVQNGHGADADGGHIGATWRIRLNCPCAAAMQPYVKLLWLITCSSCSCCALLINILVTCKGVRTKLPVSEYSANVGVTICLNQGDVDINLFNSQPITRWRRITRYDWSQNAGLSNQ